LQRIEWRNFIDFVIFIDCPREIRFEREMARSKYSGNIDELVNKYRERYWAAEDYYETTYKPSRLCDWVISNN
jgi:uridine kinase